jgi:predicted phage terminase large subunit-like protein
MVPGYFFAREPLGTIICGSHTQDKADDFSLLSQAFIHENATDLDFDVGGPFARESARAWGTTKGGRYCAISVGKKIAGERADLVILDDPIGHNSEVDSQEKRDKLWRWFWTDLRTRLRPGGRIVLIMTRWHEDDLAGRLLRSGGRSDWRVVHIRAEAGEQDVLGRKPGEMLWESAYGYGNELRALKAEYEANGRMGEWASHFQGEPTTPGGKLFHVTKIGVVPCEPSGYRWVRAWDLAASHAKGDWTVGLKLGTGPDKTLCVSNIIRFRGGPSEVERAISMTARRDGVGTTISIPQDPGQAGVAQVAYLSRSLVGHIIKATRETGSKQTRALPAAAQVNVGNVSLVEDNRWNDIFLDELASFPSGTYDDQVDALSRAILALVSDIKPAYSLRTSFMER